MEGEARRNRGRQIDGESGGEKKMGREMKRDYKKEKRERQGQIEEEERKGDC